jgi:DUF1009 family protein
MEPKLGIVAGGGDLPAQIIAACRARGRPVFVLALLGQADPEGYHDVPHAWIRLGEGGTGLEIMRHNRVSEIVFAGRVRRPSIAELRPDKWTAKFVGRLGLSLFGDDGLLKKVLQEVEAAGFHVVAPDSILTDVLAPLGPFAGPAPDAGAEVDIARGVRVARLLGEADVGQAVVVQQGIVLGVEAVEGTDALLARCALLRRDGPGGVLVKLSKPGQEQRVDLPTVGAATVERAADAGLRGIAVEARRTLVVDRAAVARAAETRGLFVVGVAADGK